MLGFKVDNCINENNVVSGNVQKIKDVFNFMDKNNLKDMPFESGLECYSTTPYSTNINSEILNKIREYKPNYFVVTL